MITESLFKALWWLKNPHGQTIYASIRRHIKLPQYRKERFELPDGDFVDLAWVEAGLPKDAPLVIILHGLGGSIHSRYVAGFMQAFKIAGWRTVLMHFRGASGEANRLPRAYHSGDTADLDYLVQVLDQREPETKKAIVGVSLGGNVLLKWLGEQGLEKRKARVDAAVAVSVPLELDRVASRVTQGFSRIYQAYLLKKLRKVFKQKLAKGAVYSESVLQEIEKGKCFWTFDDKVTAPLYGFPHVHAYYRESSSRQFLKYIQTPTLIIQALDDPFMTPEVLPVEAELSLAVTLELSKQGGHVGFIAGNKHGRPVYWLDQRIPAYLKAWLE